LKIHPDLYHGAKKQKNFFEGWYFKIVDKYGMHALAFIPGISKSRNKADHHSFLQVINAVDHSYQYYRYKADSFYSDKKCLDIKIANHSFSLNKVKINLQENKETIIGSLSLASPIKWPDSKLSPGSMGFYNHFSFMECYSQVCAIDGVITNGDLLINDKKLNFAQGKYYIEKNWGRSFPSSWIWIQSNHFPDNRATVTCSLGLVPFPIIKSFRGFLIGVSIDQDFYTFTTMNRSSLTLNSLGDDVILTSKNRNLTLTLKTTSRKAEFLQCYGPKDGKMIPLVQETLTGEVEMTLFDTENNKLIYQGIGKACGIEYGGNQQEIIDAYTYS